jgi:hypothetical protein
LVISASGWQRPWPPNKVAWKLQENLPLFQLPQPELKVQLAERLGTLAATDKLFQVTSSWEYEAGGFRRSLLLSGFFDIL